MTEALYGYCPECQAPGVSRERRPNGNDQCANGHTYPSANAVIYQHPQPSGWNDVETIELGGKSFTMRGWMPSKLQRQYMAEIAAQSPAGCGAEIGSWCGVSACWLAWHMPPNGKLHCIDTFMSTTTPRYNCEPRPTFAEFVTNTHRVGIFHKLIIHKGYSYDTDILEAVPNDLDWIYIDGGHEYDDVIHDIALYKDKVRTGCPIMFHDWDWVPVRTAIEEAERLGWIGRVAEIDKDFAVGIRGVTWLWD